ncbi:hypothetical protein CQ019_03895 [Arthrobacter sp. MYb229]|uniref:hypothetical protein n=1 Tax=Micrococcaceae TaxID=1268 RepID=UPI000BB7AE02|nr:MULTISPECIES: hypothetical protein [Micrococcaceae]PCC29267.1 hypothetical protein CIK76_07585 [Glutamicibacter sp. BW80]PRA06532.1 hypothetical protein CQ019_03895 [Arthrobacter sp. MYb229]PRB53434.1 hypothetical protein CQ013_03895 [Arthrobacter sp. MYb216]
MGEKPRFIKVLGIAELVIFRGTLAGFLRGGLVLAPGDCAESGSKHACGEDGGNSYAGHDAGEVKGAGLSVQPRAAAR